MVTSPGRALGAEGFQHQPHPIGTTSAFSWIENASLESSLQYAEGDMKNCCVFFLPSMCISASQTLALLLSSPSFHLEICASQGLCLAR